MDQLEARPERQLYVGNLPPNITNQWLRDQLNTALLVMGKFKESSYLPVQQCWISKDGHYAFVEFKSIADADECRDIAKMTLRGHDLKIGKTKCQSQGTGSVFTSEPVVLPESESTSEPSAILKLSNIVDLSRLKTEDDYQRMENDIGQECARYVKVLDLIIPRPSRHTLSKHAMARNASVAGYCFLKLESVTTATYLQRKLATKWYRGRQLQADYY